MTENQDAQPRPPHFRCDCVPELGPAHCHRCTENRSVRDQAIVQWEDAPCRQLVESFAYEALLATGSEAALLLISEAFDAEVSSEPVPHLMARLPIGAKVRLLADSWYLREEHSAEAGCVGTIVAHSDLHRDDDGLLVDWGNGRPVRCDLDELAAL